MAGFLLKTLDSLFIVAVLTCPFSGQSACNILVKRAELERLGSGALEASSNGSVIYGQNRKSGDITIWSSETGKVVNVLKDDIDNVDVGSRIVVSGTGRVLATMLKHRSAVWIVDTVSREKIAELDTAPFSDSAKMKMSPDGKFILTGDYTRGAALWNINAKRYIGRLEHSSMRDFRGNEYPFLGATFSPDSKIVATSYWGFIYLWSSDSAKFIKRLYYEGELDSKPFGFTSFTYGIEFSPDGMLLAAAGRDGKTRLWEVESGDLRASLEQGDRVFSAVFSVDGQFLATVSYDDRNIKVWDSSSGKLLYTVKGGKATPYSVTFSSAEINLIAVPVRRGVEFRETTTGNLVEKCDNLFGHFLADGSFIGSLRDGGIGLFKIARKSHIAGARMRSILTF